MELRERQDKRRFTRWAGIQGSAERTVLSLGDATLELLQFEYPGRPCPSQLSPYDTRFQHLGIVVTDMQRALERLSQTHGWTAISTGGPQKLPANDGGVTAFKFQDPDGHPLEFLQFNAAKVPVHWQSAPVSGVYHGIDHSAISVADANRSVHFYESLGLRVSERTINSGATQERLDGVPSPVVDVISLAPQRQTPHVELLHYQSRSRPRHDDLMSNDTAATRLIFETQQTKGTVSDGLLQDPDGHFLQMNQGDID